MLKKHFEEFSAQDLCTVLKNVGDVIKRYKLKTLRLSKQNDFTDKMPFSTFLDILKETPKDCERHISICYGTTTIPPDDIRNKIIEENHDSVIGGHIGVTKTYRRIREKYFWQGMKDDITEYLRNYTKCQELKLVRIKN